MENNEKELDPNSPEGQIALEYFEKGYNVRSQEQSDIIKLIGDEIEKHKSEFNLHGCNDDFIICQYLRKFLLTKIKS